MNDDQPQVESSRFTKIQGQKDRAKEGGVKPINSYSKVYNLGHREVENLLEGDVIVEEKYDGSQFSFAKIDGVLRFRSKNQEVHDGNAPNLFQPAIEHLKKLTHKIETGWTFRCEAFKGKRHNTLTYGRVPNGNMVIFDIDTRAGGQKYLRHQDKAMVAGMLGIECAALLYEGPADDLTMVDFDGWLKLQSSLGGTTIEGIVIKNYALYDFLNKTLMGKHVSEKFKEINKVSFSLSSPGGQQLLQQIADELRTEARWEKAVQHLNEKDLLQNAPQDIGPLMKEVCTDVYNEYADKVKERLFKWGWKHISRRLVTGLPEWYKNKLAEKQFEKKEGKVK